MPSNYWFFFQFLLKKWLFEIALEGYMCCFKKRAVWVVVPTKIHRFYRFPVILRGSNATDAKI